MGGSLKGFTVLLMETVIERLSTEKEEYDRQYFDEGYQAGLEDAKEMSYEEIAEVLSSGSYVCKTDAWDSCCADKVGDLQHEDTMFNCQSYAEGWVDGIREFLKSVENKL